MTSYLTELKKQDFNTSLRRISFYNFESEQVPGYAVVEVQDAKMNVGENALWVRKSTGVGPYMVNGRPPVPAGTYGSCYLDWPVRVLFDPNDGTPLTGQEWGPKAGQWALAKDEPGYTIVGNVLENDTVLANPTLAGGRQWGYVAKNSATPIPGRVGDQMSGATCDIYGINGTGQLIPTVPLATQFVWNTAEADIDGLTYFPIHLEAETNQWVPSWGGKGVAAGGHKIAFTTGGIPAISTGPPIVPGSDSCAIYNFDSGTGELTDSGTMEDVYNTGAFIPGQTYLVIHQIGNDWFVHNIFKHETVKMVTDVVLEGSPDPINIRKYQVDIDVYNPHNPTDDDVVLGQVCPPEPIPAIPIGP